MAKNELVVVFSGVLTEAGLYKGLLESHGISAHLIDPIMGGLAPYMVAPGGVGAVKLQVARKDAKEAQAILAAFKFEEGQMIKTKGKARMAPAPPKKPSRAAAAGGTWPWLIAVALIVGLAGRTVYHSGHVKYFRRVQYTAGRRLEGRYPVSESMASKGRAYRFSYGLGGKLNKVAALWRGSLTLVSDRDLGAARVSFSYGQNQETRQYRNGPDQPAINQQGVSAERLDFNDAGQLAGVTNLDEEGAPTADKYGVAKLVLTPDHDGRPSESVRLDLAGKQICDAKGFCSLHNAFDPLGRRLAWSNHDEKGSLTGNSDGIARGEYSYDADGNNTEIRYYGADGRLKSWPDSLCAQGRWCAAIVRRKFDQDGNVLERSYWDSKGRLVENEGAFAIERMEYDENGNPVQYERLGKDERPKAWPNGAIVVKSQYASDGRWLSTAYLDAAGAVVDRENPHAKPIEHFHDNPFSP
jgi:hypothetical protein